MERLHIAFFGPTNSGKSTLVNAIAGQPVSLVSAVPGTTTDPVHKPIEIPGLGPCVLIDTAGLDDTGVLGAERQRLTLAVLDEADVAVVLSDPDFAALASQAGIPVIEYTRGESVESLIRRIQEIRPPEMETPLTGDLVKPGDTVLLVMPQDSEAPKGRLILPQVQVLRELLDRGCVPHCCTPETLKTALESLNKAPELVITDSQAFAFVNQAIPPEWPLTSFSVLLAAAKGDIHVFVEGAEAIARLKPGDRVLIAEACTHVPDTEDIGRVKIPALLRKRVESGAADGFPSREHFFASGTKNQSSEANDERNSGRVLEPRAFFCERDKTRSCEAFIIDIAAGNAFPDDLSAYDLIIHCGACVAGRQLVRTRTRRALLAGVPITNYGIALAWLQGILGRIAIPGLQTRRQSS